MSSYKPSTSSVLEEGSSLIAGNNVCSAFFCSIEFPSPSALFSQSQQRGFSHVQTRASKKAKEEARTQLEQAFEKLNTTEYVFA